MQECLLAQNHKAPVPTLPHLTQEVMKAQGTGPRSREGRESSGVYLPSPINRSEKLGPQRLRGERGTVPSGEERHLERNGDV